VVEVIDKAPVPDACRVMLLGDAAVIEIALEHAVKPENEEVPPLITTVPPDKVIPGKPLVSTEIETVPLTVTVPVPELESNPAVSLAPGTPALPAPPELNAQCVVVVVSHVPAPPTQKKLAI
jgi:hypothetical protein